MTETLCPGPLTVESEFQIVPATSSHPAAQLTGACGPNASGSAARAASQSSTTPDTLTVYRAMRGLGLGDSNGVSNAGQLRQTLASMGYTITTPIATSQEEESVTAFLARMAGHQPIVLEIANGQALHDELTGQGEDASGLQYHFVCILGRNTGGASARTSKSLPAGYWVADGDNNVQNPVVSGKRNHRGLNGDLVYYSDATLAAAKPYSAFAVAKKGGGSVSSVPTGWKDDGKTLTAPNGVPVTQGFRDYVLAHSWAANNTPLAPERVVSAGSIEYGNASAGPGSRQDFRFCSLGWTSAWNVYVIAVGQDVTALAAQMAALRSQVGTLTQQLAAAQVAVANAPKPDPVATELLAAVRAAAKGA